MDARRRRGTGSSGSSEEDDEYVREGATDRGDPVGSSGMQ